jgi:hypothetical protein
MTHVAPGPYSIPFVLVALAAATHRCPHSLFFTAIMSTIPSTSTSHSNFASIFNTTLDTYKRKTRKDLASHPLLPRIQSCDSPEAILTVLREQIPAFSQSQNGDDGLTKWVIPTINVLYSFPAAIGEGVGLVNIRMFLRESFQSNYCFQASSPASIIFAGISVLLSVSELCGFLAQPILIPERPRMSAPAKTSSLTSSTASSDSSTDLKYTLASHRLRQ